MNGGILYCLNMVNLKLKEIDMAKPTVKQYSKIVKALRKAGYSVESEETQKKLFEALKANDFKVIVKDVEYQVYAARVIAVMHEGASKGKGLKL
jgi:PleD family two-component response regulator